MRGGEALSGGPRPRAGGRTRCVLRALLAAAVVTSAAAAQSSPETAAAAAPPSLTLTFEQAFQYALDHYPAARAAQERMNASAAAVSAARTAYWPRLDSTWQSTLATTDNVFGQVLPQSVIPALTGPVLDSESNQGVYGSAAGALLSWQPFDFGLRKATVAGAEAELSRARAGEALTRLDVQRAVGAAFLDVLAGERAVAASRADLERRDQLARSVRVLADNQLRPGAEAARADAERAAAQIRLIQAEATLSTARTRLERALGLSGTEVTIDARGVSGPGAAEASAAMPSSSSLSTAAAHPLALARQASIEAARAQETTVARTDLPRVYLQSSVFARGSGASPDGTLDSSPDGLGLDRDNWAVGVQILFPNLFAFTSLRARKAVASASRSEATALYDETLLAIESERDNAAALLAAARAVAAATPVELEAARQSEAQAGARYQAGLGTLVDVADAQGLLAHAEVTDELARIDVWRARLALAVADGDLGPFVAAARAAAGQP